MKPVGLISTGILLLLLGAVAPTYAQQGQNKQDATAPQQQQQQQGKGQQKQQGQQQQQGKGQQKQQGQQQQQGKGQQNQQRKQQQQATRQQRQQQQQAAWRAHRASNWQSEHRSWQQRGGYNGYRIPEARYRVYFGPRHMFRINRYPVMVIGGYPRFQYGGFWFGFVDPWPEYWSDDWYENDDVYVDYSGDGYYLYNSRYPQVRIAVMVYLR